MLGVFFGVWILAAVFFLPYAYRKLISEDRRLRFWHIPMGPLLWKKDYNLYWPGSPDHDVVPNYYSSEYKGDGDNLKEKVISDSDQAESKDLHAVDNEIAAENDGKGDSLQKNPSENHTRAADGQRVKSLGELEKLSWAHPKRIFGTLKFVFMYGITRDIIGHQSVGLDEVHRRAPQFDNKVEHLWTTAQVCSAMIMSIAHGANDVSNAIGPFTTEYETWSTGVTSAKTDTPGKSL